VNFREQFWQFGFAAFRTGFELEIPGKPFLFSSITSGAMELTCF